MLVRLSFRRSPDPPCQAAELADLLRGARTNDPLFDGAGEPADLGTLLTAPPGKRARISVISRIGLPGEEQWQSFVNVATQPL